MKSAREEDKEMKRVKEEDQILDNGIISNVCVRVCVSKAEFLAVLRSFHAENQCINAVS